MKLPGSGDAKLFGRLARHGAVGPVTKWTIADDCDCETVWVANFAGIVAALVGVVAVGLLFEHKAESRQQRATSTNQGGERTQL